MAIVHAQILLDGQPLTQCYVQHVVLGPFDVELITLGHVLTDNQGKFSMDAGPGFNEVDVKVRCHNSVLEVLDEGPLPFVGTDIYFAAHVVDGDGIDVTAHKNHFRILTICLDVYRTVWRQFKPYNRASRRIFPLGSPSSVTPRELTNRMKAVFPETNEIGTTHYVAPIGSVNGLYPYIHFKSKLHKGSAQNFRPTQAESQEIIAHEFGHCMHFSALSLVQRTEVSARYLAFLIEHRDNPGHRLDRASSPFVAFIEAIGHFSETFYKFSKNSNLSGQRLRQSFFRSQVNYDRVGVVNLDTNGRVNSITPTLTGNDIEGAVYGAIFLDLARRIGLREVVGLVLESGAMSFDDFSRYIVNQGDASSTTAIRAVAQTWTM